MAAVRSAARRHRRNVTPGGFTDCFVRVARRAWRFDVDQELGKVVLDVSGRQITAYWEIETNLAQGGAIVGNGPVRAPVANYHEPIAHRELFPAVPGDVIAFVGYQTGKEILLRGVEVLPQ